MMLRIVLAFCMVAGFAAAQQQEAATPAPQQQQQQQPQEVSLDKKEVQNFTVAFVQIAQLKQVLGQKLQTKDGSKPSKEVQKSVNKEFQTKAQNIIKKAGLSIQRYGQYIQLLQQSDDFKQLVKGIIAQMSNQPAKK